MTTRDNFLLDAHLTAQALGDLSRDRLRDLVSDAHPLAADLLGSSVADRADASIIFNNVSQIMAIALRQGDDELFSEGISCLVEIWKEGSYEALMPLEPPAFEASLWETLAVNLYALGGLAVADEQWPKVRELTLQAPTGGKSEKSWLRQGQVASSRANNEYPDESMLQLASRRLRRMRAGISEAESLQHLARFDLLSGLIIGEENSRGFYPNAAEFTEELVEPLVIDELRDIDSPPRKHVFVGDNAGMIEALVEYDRQARLQAALARFQGQCWRWRGFSDARTLVFLAEGHILEEWVQAHRR